MAKVFGATDVTVEITRNIHRARLMNNQLTRPHNDEERKTRQQIGK